MKKTIDFKVVHLDDLFLDPLNPRLGRDFADKDLSQEAVLEQMRDWTLDELATSFIENGFWPQEALIVVRESYLGEESNIVVEGNRRLAALKYLQASHKGLEKSRKWKQLTSLPEFQESLFGEIPVIEVKSREEVASYLGFRHVTGIKEWNPAEKAEFIAKLIDVHGYDYRQVTRRIGSKLPTVKKNYIAFKLLMQMSEQEEIHLASVEKKFSVLYLSLRSLGVQDYLGIDIEADIEDAAKPVPRENAEKMVHFARWVFGGKGKDPLISDSRKVDQFGRILENEEAVSYLERHDEPKFNVAFSMAGGDVKEVVDWVNYASDYVKAVLPEAHQHIGNEALEKAIDKLSMDIVQLALSYPDIVDKIKKRIDKV